MDYIRQHIMARRRREALGLCAGAWDVYSKIFYEANDKRNLAGPVKISAADMMAACGIKNNDTLRTYRQNLINAGMITYIPGHGRGSTGIYRLVDLTNEAKRFLTGTSAVVEKKPELEPEPEPVPETAEQGTLLREPETIPLAEQKKRRKKEEKPEPPAKRPYGTYQNVMLSDFQYKKLLELHGPEVTAMYIEKIGSYVYEKPGHAYKDYLRAINDWIARDKAKGRFWPPVPAAPALPAATEAEKAAAAAIENDVDDIFMAARAARLQAWR